MLDTHKHTLARLLRRFRFSQVLLHLASRLYAARFSAGVVAVVTNNQGQILLVEHVFHPILPWGLPGGWLHARESPADALVRELTEETGIEVNVERPLLVETARVFGTKHIDVALLCTAQSDVKFLSGELLNYAWVNPQHMPPINVFHEAAIAAYLVQEQVLESTM